MILFHILFLCTSPLTIYGQYGAAGIGGLGGNPAALSGLGGNPAAGLAAHPTAIGGLGGTPAALGGLGGNPAALGELGGNPASAMAANPAGLGGLGANPAALGGLGGNPAAGMAANPAALGGLGGNPAALGGLGGNPAAAMAANPTAVGGLGGSTAALGGLGGNPAALGGIGKYPATGMAANPAALSGLGGNPAAAMAGNPTAIGGLGGNPAALGRLGGNPTAGLTANPATLGRSGGIPATGLAANPGAIGGVRIEGSSAPLSGLGGNHAGLGGYGGNGAGIGGLGAQNAALGGLGGQNSPIGGLGGQNSPIGGLGGQNSPIGGLGGQVAGIGGLAGPVTGNGGLGGQVAGIGGLAGPVAGNSGLGGQVAGIGGLAGPVTGNGRLGGLVGSIGGLDPLAWIKNYLNVFTLSPFSHGQQPNPDKPNPWSSQYQQNFSIIGKHCPRSTFYASFNPEHRRAVEILSKLYDDRTDMNDMMEFSQFAKLRQEVHPMVWYASFLRAHCRKFPQALNAVERPSPMYLFPTIFIPQLTNGYTPNRKKRQLPQQQCLVLDERFGQDNGAENALWYFREDLQINSHHWIWHLLFPTSTSRPITRRGELFYFFHHDLLARYTTERLANGFQPVGPIAFYPDFNAIVAEGYNPHMADGISTMPWAPREAGVDLSQNNLPRDVMDTLANLTVIRDRLLESASTGTVNRGGTRLSISQGDNINILGELTEASLASINPDWYGMSGFHNDGHWVIANLIPRGWQRGPIGVMGHQATALRDMVFYRWHKMVDDVFQMYKGRNLPPYGLNSGDYPLVVAGISVGGIRVVPNGAQPNVNALRTFWNLRRMTLEGGLDFNIPNSQQAPNINVCAKHLDHEEFSYEISVGNTRGRSFNAYVRIFMAPRFKSLNGQERYTYEEQRGLFFTMDAFPFMLQAGNNVIRRSSVDSTLTAPWPRSIQQLRQDAQFGNRANIPCECGYPHHLLLPKGTENGMPFDLFVMLTDASIDFTGSGQGGNQSPLGNRQCIPSHIHCGINGRDYPDRKPMGYPFDRIAYTVPVNNGNGVQNVQPINIENFVSNIPNMATTQIVITHQNIQVGQ